MFFLFGVIFTINAIGQSEIRFDSIPGSRQFYIWWDYEHLSDFVPLYLPTIKLIKTVKVTLTVKLAKVTSLYKEKVLRTLADAVLCHR